VTLTKSFYQKVYIILEVIRVFAIAVIMKFPFGGWLIIFLIDTFDYYPALRTGITYSRYQQIDKSLDILNRLYFVLPAYFFSWPHKHLFLVLFLYRLVGEFFFFKVKSERYLFFFPNLLEFLFPAYIIFSENFVLALIVALPLKLIHEYGLHIKGMVDPWSKSYITAHPEHQRKFKS